jgi:FecR-like protein
MTAREDDRDERIDPELLAAYEVPAPSADLGDRYMARWRRRGEGESTRRSWWRIGAAAAALVAAGIGIGLVVGRRDPSTRDDAPAAGEASVAERHEIRIRGGIAVAEANARIRWHVDDAGAMHVEQLRGDVFYRVELGLGFVVETPAGSVTTLGTCFRVETSASGDVVTVYEGAVQVANASGSRRVSAGERVGASITAAATTTPDDRAKIAQLQARIARLEADARLAVQPLGMHADRNPMVDLTPEKLAELARVCHVPYDVPPFAGSSLVDRMIEEGYSKLGFTADERRAVTRVVEKLQPAYEAELHALYTELTGESGDALDLLTLTVEIAQKTPAADLAAAQRQVSRERAGLATPPRDSGGTVIERMLRSGIALGDVFERALARELPAARAHEFRRTWGGVNLGPSCAGP